MLERMLHAGGDTRVVEVTVNGGGMHNVLVKNVQREPVGHRLLHADFYAVNMSEKQRVTVPLVATGKPAGMVTGVMVLKLHEAIHIEALPADIPGEIEVDISPMTMERPITIADLPKVKGVSYVDDPEEVLFNLQLTREEVAEEAAASRGRARSGQEGQADRRRRRLVFLCRARRDQQTGFSSSKARFFFGRSTCSLGYWYTGSSRNCVGSTATPLTRISQCRWAPVLRPVLPTMPITSPAATCWPTCTLISLRCQ